LSDILFVFFILLSIYFFSKLIKGKDEKEYLIPLILSSIFIAIATLIRPITIYLPILLILFLLIYFKGKIKYAFKLVLIFLVIFILTLSPWMIRNAIIFGSYSLSSSSTKSLIEMYVPPFEMEKRNQPYETVTSSLMNEADSLMLKDGYNPYKMDEFQKSPYWKKVALKHIAENPILFLKHYAIGTIHYFVNLGTRGYSDMLNLEVKTKDFDIKGKPNPLETIKLWFAKKSLTEILIGIFISLFLLVSYSGLLAGLIMGWKKYNKAYLVLCLLMVFYFVLTTGPQGLERYRLPSIPFYLTFTSLGIIYIIDRFKSKSIHKN
jgi:4-amino-4-deoxy-L-arabinose transferase-like glycosyltransferase